jgi:flagellar export protein FliJ
VGEFHFPLGSVMRFRERIKQEKQWELSLLNEERRVLEEQIHSLEQELLRAEASTAPEEGMICSAMELRLRADYARVLARRIPGKRDSLGVLDQKLAAKRDELVEAMRSVKILEQLRKRLEEKFRHDLDLADQKVRDEIGLRKFIGPGKGQDLP